MIGKPDTKNMEFVFDVDGIGPLYMINVENSFLANNPLDFKNPKLNTWINSCSDSGCFETNRFFLFRADGTFLIYDVKPPVLTDNLIPAENQKRIGFTEYTTSTLTTCEARSVAAVTPLSRKFIEKNPTEFYGIIPQNKDSFWVFEESAPVLKEAFTILKDAQNYWDENCTETKNFTDYESFVANIPLLVWKDPFNRSILYKIKELNPPACCEPVFYLYSEKDTTVSINLKYPETIRNSRPTIIDSGWTITIDKNKMIYGAVKENIPFVFWEGWVGVVPKPQTGFIVSRGELEKFMREKLCTTGLNNDEIIDFCNQWLKKCPEAPFYAVHFYDTEFAQRYCPVAISPQPQTIIRIYIDIEPCQKRRELRAQEINQVNERRGLTYVEWGAMVRSRNEF